ncbi:MAG: hypothetical protein Q9216_006413 [Gyalolechia sp. 2 TL-2023]
MDEDAKPRPLPELIKVNGLVTSSLAQTIKYLTQQQQRLEFLSQPSRIQMLSTGYSHHSQIQYWIQEVVKETQQQLQRPRGPSHAMRLRSRADKPDKSKVRQPLPETIGNRLPQKRPPEIEDTQRIAAGSDKRRKEMGNEEVPQKKRGRPPKDKLPQRPDALDPTYRPELQLRAKSQGTSSASSPGKTPSARSKGGSPTRGKRKNVPSLDYVKPDSALTMTDLESCQPKVFQMDIQRARKSGPLPPAVYALYKALTGPKHACIPSDLKESYREEFDTPQKSREPLPDDHFLPGTAKQFPSPRVQRMKESVDMIHEDAGCYHRAKVHERNWGKLISVILSDYEIFYRNTIAWNVESCSIAPNEIRPTSSTGEPIVTDKSVTDTDNESSTIPIGRMIDWVLALRLDHEDNMLISDAFAKVPFSCRSLNQSLTDFLRKCPTFLDFELKKEQAARDPEVQLAVWASAGLKKKKLMGWSTELPMPGIVVDGHKWTCYLFFEQKQYLVSHFNDFRDLLHFS